MQNRSHTSRGRHSSVLPCPAGRSALGRGGPERRRRPRQTGPQPTGTQCVYMEPAGRGLQRARAVTTGHYEPQVRPPTQQPAGSLPGGGPELEPPPGCCEPSGLLPTSRWSPRGTHPLAELEAVAARGEHRRSCRPCHPRAISSGHQRYLAVNHGHFERAVMLGTRR